MRYLIIDPERREVTEHEHPGQIDGAFIRTIIGGWLGVVGFYPNGDTLYVDDDGLTDPARPVWCFDWTGYPVHPVAGRGVLVGPEELPQGATDPDDKQIVSARTPLEQLRADVAWVEKPQLVTLTTREGMVGGMHVTSVMPSFRDAT